MDTSRSAAERFFKQLKGMRESEVNLSQLVDKKNRVTFVSAIPGSGKSVLVKQLVYNWACNRLFRNFKVCITFECRELNYFALNEGTKFERRDLIHEFIKNKFNVDIGKVVVLFIVDGLDELYDVYEDDSIIGQLLDHNKSKYHDSKIIITGRPLIEKMLLTHGGNNMGGVRKLGIPGLSDAQITNYIAKFASSIDGSSDDVIAKINEAKKLSEGAFKFIHVPQMLNSFCCVVILSDVKRIRNPVELYCWSLYLLLKQHADKGEKGIPDIFCKYSNELQVLSQLCHKFLISNTLIFEGNIEDNENGKGSEFLKGLFVDVSDNFHEKKQFKHLTLMEFLSAFYVCTIENPTIIIKDILEKRLDQVLLFNCQLIAGLMYDGIIKEMFKNAPDLKEVKCEDFFHLVLTLVRECVTGDKDESFKLSIDVVMCLMNKDIFQKQDILSPISQLIFHNVGSNSLKLIDMMKVLISDFKCLDGELKKAFENVHFGEFFVLEINDLQFAKYFASVDDIKLCGMRCRVKTTVKEIRKKIDEINDLGNCKRLSILKCILQDKDVDDELSKSYKLESLQIWDCTLNRNSIINLCKWVKISSIEEFELGNIEDMTSDWWNIFVDVIVSAKEKNDNNIALRKLVLRKCRPMDDDMKEKV